MGDLGGTEVLAVTTASPLASGSVAELLIQVGVARMTDSPTFWYPPPPLTISEERGFVRGKAEYHSVLWYGLD